MAITLVAFFARPDRCRPASARTCRRRSTRRWLHRRRIARPGINHGREVQIGVHSPGAWVLTANPRCSTPPASRSPGPRLKPCVTADPDTAKRGLRAQNLHSELTYQPADRYWTFQWLEPGVFLLLALLFAGQAFRRISRGLS